MNVEKVDKIGQREKGSLEKKRKLTNKRVRRKGMGFKAFCKSPLGIYNPLINCLIDCLVNFRAQNRTLQFAVKFLVKTSWLAQKPFFEKEGTIPPFFRSQDFWLGPVKPVAPAQVLGTVQLWHLPVSKAFRDAPDRSIPYGTPSKITKSLTTRSVFDCSFILSN